MKSLDIAAIGTCYVDTNATDFPFTGEGIAAGTEVVGGGYETVAGGSAVNFCRLLTGMGLQTAFIGMSGSDETGDRLKDLLEEANVKPYIARHAGYMTNISFNMTSNTGEHILCVAGTANSALSLEAVNEVLVQAAADAKILYIGGCFKLKALSDDFMKVAQIAQRQGAKLAVDHGRVPSDTTAAMKHQVRALVLAADYYFPSRDEFCTLWDVDDLQEGIRQVAGRAPGLCLVVKDGANGAFYLENGAISHVPGNQVSDVKDLTGAGDAFNAGTIAAILAGQHLGKAVSYGCDVAAAKIAKADLPALVA